VRIYSGKIRKGQNVYNPRLRSRERVTRIVRLHADSRTEADVLHSGEIGALVGLKQATTGDTLCTENVPVELERITFPEPVMFMAVEPKSRADRDRLEQALAALAAEDPTCVIRTHPETGQTIISGMGELHLEIIVDRLQREFRVTPTSAVRRSPTGRRSGRRFRRSRASSSPIRWSRPVGWLMTTVARCSASPKPATPSKPAEN